MRHLVGNVTWNSNRWTAPTTAADRAHAGSASVHGGYVGNESWNFSRDQHTRDGRKYGSVEKVHTAKDFSNGSGIVFFWSRAPKQAGNVLVGAYAMASLLPKPVRLTNDTDREFNLTVPLEPKRLLCVFTEPILCVPERHLRDGPGKPKLRPGQCGFCYIDDAAAAAIICDAVAKNPEAIGIQALYGFAAKEAAMVSHSSPE